VHVKSIKFILVVLGVSLRIECDFELANGLHGCKKLNAELYVLLASFAVVFIAEIADKTMISTIMFALHSGSYLEVFLASTMGFILANALIVLFVYALRLLMDFSINGELIKLKRFKTPLRKLLTHRIWIERIQKRYPRSWRFIKGVRNAITKHGERIKNISWDYSHKVGDLIAELALRYRSIIIMEDLDMLRESTKRDKKFNKKLTLWFYGRVQFCVEYEAGERGLRAVKVNPRSTSSTCPRCSSRLANNGYRTVKCGRCGFTGDRDVVAVVNLYRKYLSNPRCGGLGVPQNAPKPNEAPSGVQGNKDEAMKITSTHINQHKS